MEILETVTCAEFARLLDKGEYDDGEVAVVASTSSEELSERLTATAWERGIGPKILVLVYDDIDFGDDLATPEGDNAFSPDQARAVVSFANDWAGEVGCFLPVCDGGVSRSAAVRAAVSRICEGEDLACWTDPRFRPNVLVYYRLLQASGVTLSREQVGMRLALKERLLDCKVRGRGIHGMHLIDEAWEAMCSGGKDIELRLLDQKRACIRPGDTLVFERTSQPEVLLATAKSLHAYGSFAQLFREWPEAVQRAGFANEDEALLAMEDIYGPQPGAVLAMDLGDFNVIDVS